MQRGQRRRKEGTNTIFVLRNSRFLNLFWQNFQRTLVTKKTKAKNNISKKFRVQKIWYLKTKGDQAKNRPHSPLRRRGYALIGLLTLPPERLGFPRVSSKSKLNLYAVHSCIFPRNRKHFQRFVFLRVERSFFRK